MFPVRNFAAFAAVLFLAVSFSHAADQVDNPKYQAWAKFKKGSTETLTGTLAVQGMQIDLEMKRTLTDITPEKATIEVITSRTILGRKMDTTTTEVIPSKVEKPDWKQGPDEEVKAMDKTFKCKVYEGKSTAPGRGGASSEADAKFYTNETVPGALVQIKMTAQAGAITYLLKSFEAK